MLNLLRQNTSWPGQARRSIATWPRLRTALDPEDLAGRLAQLKARSHQLRARRGELARELADGPAPPPPTTLRQVADHIDEIIGAGTHNQRKALIEALVANIKITGPGRVVPVSASHRPRE